MSTVKRNVTSLIGMPLDWAVARVLGGENVVKNQDGTLSVVCNGELFCASINWVQCGPLIEQYDISLYADDGYGCWTASMQLSAHEVLECAGPDARVAAMRCLVAFAMGYDVDVPSEIL